jgi:hypothetical protein
LEFPLRYRSTEEEDWRSGRGRNISRSGLLFDGERPLGLHAPIEVTFRLPVEIAGYAAATVVCQGHVVRQVGAPEPSHGATLAATIDSYRFERTPVSH